MTHALAIAVAGVATLAAIAALVAAVYVTGREIRREQERKRRGGYIELQPTPDRNRLGIDTRRSK